MSEQPRRVRCRQIGETDIQGIVEILTQGFRPRLKTGFRGRSRRFFVRALERLSEHRPPPGFPKYGYLLESEGIPVGVLLLIYSMIFINGEPTIRCNVCYWYVQAAFRSYAAMLVSQALKHKDVTYYNISPEPYTLSTLEAQGYRRYCSGRLLAVPALCRRSCDTSVQMVTPDTSPGADLPPFEIDLLLTHARYGCLSLICSSATGRRPFVFKLGRFRVIPYAYLVYCRELEDFLRFAGPLGRFLARHGYPFVVLDSNGPIRGLIARYSSHRPKYFRGPNEPRLGDLAYSERAMFPYD